VRSIQLQLISILALVIGLAAPARAQLSTDLIRGRIVGQDSFPLVGARVTVTSIVTQMGRTTTTNVDGRYTIPFPGGGGNYLASFNMIGFRPVVRQIKRLDDEDVLVADVVMVRAPVQLTDVMVVARPLPRRGNAELPDSTGTWDVISGAGSAASDLGNLAAMASQLPGVSMVTDADGNSIGVSVLGLGHEQNTVTIDGVQQEMNEVPTEGMPAATITKTTSDPSRGGFSGAAVEVRSRPGSWQVARSLGLIVDEPRLQWADQVATQLGRQYRNVQLSGQSSGPVVKDKLFYRGSFQAGRRTSDRHTILNTGGLALAELGASVDSVRKLRTTMEELGLPLSVPGIPGSQLTDNASLMLRADFTPAGSHAINATFNGAWKEQASSSSSPLTTPASGGRTETLTASGQLNHSVYIPFGILSETKLALSVNNGTTGAFMLMPDVRVRIRSEALGSQGRSVANFQVGGNSSMPVATRNSNWQFVNSLSWVSKDNAHRVKWAVEIKQDEYRQNQATNRFGTFTFNSLEDFAAGQPSEYRRQLTETNRNADLLTSAVSLGDQWRRTKNLSIQYGLRLEADRYGSRPAYNPEVERIFGVRNDHAPNARHVSPRLGFTWNYGTAPQIAAFEGAVRGPRATLKGTIGEYRNTPKNSLIQAAMGATGLPSGIQTLTCRGSATPFPDWESFARDPSTIPVECADGTGSSVFADAQPNVVLFHRNYEPQRSWRADLGWSGTALRRYKLAVNGVVSLNRAQPGTYSLNFRDSVHFRLPAESERPVFVRATSISSRSGSVATRDARISSDFARVTERRSDLSSHSAEWSLTFSPVVVAPRAVRWSVGYVNAQMTERTRGFGGTTAGDPRELAWNPASGPSHQFNISTSYSLLGFTLGLATRVTSGVRFTPMVRGDINGDGESNDRAFVFHPTSASDEGIGGAMRILLDEAPPSVSRCLSRQVGTIAGANSCTGPWSSVMNLSLSLEPRKFQLPGRTTLSMTFANPMTGVDLLVNGASEPRSWGALNNRPDATLLYVRGFDPVAQEFRYEVNPRFGNNRETSAIQGKPFLITLRFSTDMSPPMEKQTLRRQLDGWRDGSTRKPNESALRRQYTQRFTSPFQSIMRQRDTLGLSPEQADSIAAMNAAFNARLDSLWAPVVEYISAIEGAYRLEDVFSRVRETQRRSYDLLALHARAVKAVLTSDQFNRLPQSFGAFFDDRELERMQRAAGIR
jgi:hypothetical protein